MFRQHPVFLLYFIWVLCIRMKGRDNPLTIVGKEKHTMNDLTVNAFKETFEGITYEHDQPEDLTLYREKAVFKKIPLWADVPVADVQIHCLLRVN